MPAVLQPSRRVPAEQLHLVHLQRVARRLHPVVARVVHLVRRLVRVRVAAHRARLAVVVVRRVRRQVAQVLCRVLADAEVARRHLLLHAVPHAARVHLRRQRRAAAAAAASADARVLRRQLVLLGRAVLRGIQLRELLVVRRAALARRDQRQQHRQRALQLLPLGKRTLRLRAAAARLLAADGVGRRRGGGTGRRKGFEPRHLCEHRGLVVHDRVARDGGAAGTRRAHPPVHQLLCVLQLRLGHVLLLHEDQARLAGDDLGTLRVYERVLRPHLLLHVLDDDAVPPVPLALEAEVHVHDHLVSLDVLPREPGARLPRTLHAVLLLVRHRAAVLARSLPVARRRGTGVPLLIPLVHAVRVQALGLCGYLLLMLQGLVAVVGVPRRVRHVLGDVRVDLVAVFVEVRRHLAVLLRFACLHLLAVSIAPAGDGRSSGRHDRGKVCVCVCVCVCVVCFFVSVWKNDFPH
eukprot:Rhum_TRINITY_DN10412_c0_g1::Rhum_TRINITY_DN10412_c0_g1_i1::g.38354::m.38354